MALLNKQMLPLVILNKNIFLLSKHGPDHQRPDLKKDIGVSWKSTRLYMGIQWAVRIYPPIFDVGLSENSTYPYPTSIVFYIHTIPYISHISCFFVIFPGKNWYLRLWIFRHGLQVKLKRAICYMPLGGCGVFSEDGKQGSGWMVNMLLDDLKISIELELIGGLS